MDQIEARLLDVTGRAAAAVEPRQQVLAGE